LSAQSTAPLLSVRNLRTYFFTYRGVVHAVEDVDLDINRGEVVGLVGETGCGKTCTALSTMRLIQEPGRILAGEILLEGKDLLKVEEKEMRSVRGSKIAMIFQNPTAALNPVFSVGDQITEMIMLHRNVDRAKAEEEAEGWIKATGIPSPHERLSHYPHEFSVGMRQRIMIAIALSCQPSLLIADEPTTGLDVTTQAQILDLLVELKAQYNMSILYITHNLGVVAQICDRVGVMYAGGIVEFADVRTIFKKPWHPYTEGLIKALPTRFTVDRDLVEIPGTVPSLVNLPEGCSFSDRCYRMREDCKIKRPVLTELEPGHFVSCYYPAR
jgi:peptide/nickel transport system ATP-binding protein